MKSNDKPVNPTPIAGGDESVVNIHSMANSTGMTEGITLREHFASMAMQGLLSQHNLKQPTDQQIICQLSVELADTLLDELAK